MIQWHLKLIKISNEEDEGGGRTSAVDQHTILYTAPKYIKRTMKALLCYQ